MNLCVVVKCKWLSFAAVGCNVVSTKVLHVVFVWYDLWTWRGNKQFVLPLFILCCLFYVYIIFKVFSLTAVNCNGSMSALVFNPPHCVFTHKWITAFLCSVNMTNSSSPYVWHILSICLCWSLCLMCPTRPGTCVRHQPACEISPGLSHYGPFDHPGQGQHNRALTASLPGSAQGRGKGNADLWSFATISYIIHSCLVKSSSA